MAESFSKPIALMEMSIVSLYEAKQERIFDIGIFE